MSTGSRVEGTWGTLLLLLLLLVLLRNEDFTHITVITISVVVSHPLSCLKLRSDGLKVEVDSD